MAPLSQATPGGVPAQVTNTATISAGNELSGKTNNNTASDDATVNPSTDLQLSKSHSGNFTHGQHGTYTLIVTNAGAFDSAGPITVTDTLPTGWGYVASGSGDVDWTCPNTDVAPSPNVTPQVVCTHAGGLANGAQTSFPLIANVPSGIADNGPVILTNTATVAGPMPDSKGFNNSDPDDTKVVDSTPPSVTVPLDITKSNDPNLATAVVTYNASATDNTPGVTLACSPPSGTVFPLGTTTVTCTATDTSGNTDSKSFKVKVNDTQPPSVTVPLDIIQSNDPGKATAVVSYSATASDNAPGVTLSCVPPSGTAFQLGPTTVTCTATDSSANTAVKSFKVTVNDTEPPVVTVPANMTKNATSPSGAVVTFVVTATDNAPGVTKACVPSAGSTFAIGTTTVNCTATDGAGNTDTKSFQIKVLGAVDQLNNLVNLVKGMKIEPGFQSELLNRLNNAVKALNQKSTALACTELAKFVAGAKAKSGQKLSAADATTLISEANRIRQVLAC